ncbi:MAG: MBL fold metallo-hydrolase, partial [Clostridia bacterium]|nr:MBL fold metallo-hydrolase [Clostridia bacterium]
MAKRRRKKQTIKLSKPLAVFLAIVLIIAIVCGYFLWKNGYLDAYLGEHEHGNNGNVEDIITTDLSIHFPMLGNANTGDCTLIKVGNTEVLIDAGSKRGSATAVVSYVSQYCTDGVLDYVIATHAHEDHIAAFVGSATDKTDGVLEAFECNPDALYLGFELPYPMVVAAAKVAASKNIPIFIDATFASKEH